jgi:hypothetical protein
VAQAVEVQRDAEALFPRGVAPPQHRRVVAAGLGVADAVGRGAVKVVEDQRAHGLRAVVRARRHDKDAKQKLLGRRQAELRRRAVDLRADVERRARLVRRHKLGVERDGGAHRRDKDVLGHGRHREHLGRVVEPARVAVRAEHGDGPVGLAKRLEALKRLLAVVERGAHAVQLHVRRRDEAQRRPGARRPGIRRLDMAVDCGGGGVLGGGGAEVGRPVGRRGCPLTFADLEADVGPVDRLDGRRREAGHGEGCGLVVSGDASLPWRERERSLLELKKQA